MVDAFKAIVELSSTHGPLLVFVMGIAAINLFFIVQSVLRERRLNTQVKNLQDHYSETVMPILTECKEAIASSKEVIQQNSQLLMTLITARVGS